MSGMTPRERDDLTRRLIAERLSIDPDAVTQALVWGYKPGDLTDGATCPIWLRDYRPPMGGHADFDLAREIEEVRG